MTGIHRNLVFSSEMDAQISEVARLLDVNRSAAIRILIGRALGKGTARLFVDEKTLEVKNLLAKRIRRVIDEGLRAELHALVDEVNPPMVESLVPEALQEVEEERAEPELERPIEGHPRKAAKARRRR